MKECVDIGVFKKWRKSVGLKQSELAFKTGVSLSTIKKYESGVYNLSFENFKKMRSALGYLEADSERIEYMIDYLRITFKYVRDLRYFVKKFLFIDIKYFNDRVTGLMNYNHLWYYGDIWIFDFFEKHDSGNFQITLQLSGQGCRQLECQFDLENERKAKVGGFEKLSWQSWLKTLYDEYGAGMSVTRLDVACDEVWLGEERQEEHFDLVDFVSRVENGLCFSKFDVFNYHNGGKMPKLDKKTGELIRESSGFSVYFGSRRSNLYMNFYEKRYEVAKSDKVSAEQALELGASYNRYEVRMANEKANGYIYDFILGLDLAVSMRDLIREYIEVYVDIDDSGSYIPDEKWQRLFGGVGSIQIKSRPEPYSIYRTIRWLKAQVTNSLAGLKEYDRLMETEYLKNILESGEVTDKMKKEIEASCRQVGIVCFEEEVA